MLVGLGTLAYIAVDDPHFSLEPNYYDKAVHWDRARAQAQDSVATGFRAAFAGPLEASLDGRVELRLAVMDRQDRPVLGATVALEAFPNAYATRVERITLKETAPGVYAGALSRATLGLWELRLDVTQGSLRFHDVLRLDIVKGDKA